MGACQTKNSFRNKEVATQKGITEDRFKKNLTCQICEQHYNHLQRCPMMICANQHNCCHKCYDSFRSKGISICPFCRVEINTALVGKNRILLELMGQQQSKLQTKSLETNPTTTQIPATTVELMKLIAGPLPEEKLEKVEQLAVQSVDLPRNNESQMEWWKVASSSKPLNKQLMNDTLAKAKAAGYEQIPYYILMALKKPIDIVLELEQHQNSINKIVDISLFKGLKKLNMNASYTNSVKLQRNGMKGFGYLPQLKQLHLSSRHTQEIPYLGVMHDLRILDLSYNDVVRIQNLDQFPRLEQLLLNNNKIQKIQKLQKLPFLQILQLSYNKIQVIQNIQKLRCLKELYLDNNQIHQIKNLQQLGDLQILSMIDNKVRLVENLYNLTKLKKLSLGGNPIDREACKVEIKAIKDLFGIDLLKTNFW